MTKTLKIWNGRGHGKYKNGTFYVAAYSAKQAIELVGNASGCHISGNEIKKYYSENCWGNAMDGIIPTEPCVYIVEHENSPDRKRIRIQ